MYFYGLNSGHSGEDPFWTLVQYINKLHVAKNGHKAMIHTKFQAAEPGEDFWYILLARVGKSRIPWDRTILNKFGKGPQGNATYQISSISAKRF